MTAKHLNQVFLPPETNAVLDRLTEQGRTAQAVLLKELVESVVSGARAADKIALRATLRWQGLGRVRNRLRNFEWLLSERVMARRRAAAAVVCVLVRAHLGNLPISQADLNEIRDSMAALSAIGRSLNPGHRASDRQTDPTKSRSYRRR